MARSESAQPPGPGGGDQREHRAAAGDLGRRILCAAPVDDREAELSLRRGDGENVANREVRDVAERGSRGDALSDEHGLPDLSGQRRVTKMARPGKEVTRRGSLNDDGSA